MDLQRLIDVIDFWFVWVIEAIDQAFRSATPGPALRIAGKPTP